MMIWIANGISESCDHYTIGYWDHEPTKADIKNAFSCDEEFDFVNWETIELEELK